MFESTLLPERIYGLSLAEGRCPVRPGATIVLRFRLRNEAMRVTPPARLRFVVPEGWTALDPADIELPALAGGHVHVAEFRARADDVDEAAAAFQAVITLAELNLGSNVVHVMVRGRPRLDGPASGLRLEPGDGPDRIDAIVEIVNEGDAIARAARVFVPPPPGFLAVDGIAECDAGDLAPGVLFTCRFALRALKPPAADVRIDDAFVRTGSERTPLRTIVPFVLESNVAAPLVELTRTATRLDAIVRLRNDGPLAASDVPCRLELPPGWRALRGTFTLEGAPAAVRTHDGALTIAVPFIPGRGTVECRLSAVAIRTRTGESLRVTCADRSTIASIPPATRRSLRLDSRSASAWAGTAESMTVGVLLWNDGETDETIALSAAGTVGARIDLRAGRSAHTSLTIRIPDDARADEMLAIVVTAAAADGTVLATNELVLRIDSRTAPEHVLEAGDDLEPEPAELTARWDLPARAQAGAPFDVRLLVRADRAVDTLRIAPGLPEGATYVAGSSRIDGIALVDRRGDPALFAGGLTLYGIPPASEIAVAWQLIPGEGDDLTLSAALDADGARTEVAATSVAIDPVGPFAVRPGDLAFHIGAATLAGTSPAPLPAPAVTAASASPSVASVGLTLRLDDARRTVLLRMLRGSRGSTIVAHLPLLAGLFADRIDGDDPQLGLALTSAGEAVRSVYERLFVKLRIPGYDVSPYDLEDTAMRDGLVTLLDALALAPAPAREMPGDLRVEIGLEVLRGARTLLVRAPLGGIDGVATVALFVPCVGTDAASTALGAYARLLAGELEAARSLAHDAFGAYVTMHRIDALDAARERAVAALEPLASLTS